jgi:hypothetical protein
MQNLFGPFRDKKVYQYDFKYSQPEKLDFINVSYQLNIPSTLLSGKQTTLPIFSRHNIVNNT